MNEQTASAAGSSRAAIRTPALLAWFRLVHVFQKVDHLSAEHLRGHGLSVAQFDLLAQLGSHEGVTQQELARALLVTKGNVCQLLDRMARDGLIRRCQHGRANLIYLTDEGRRLFARVVPAQEALIIRLFSSLTVEEQVQLLGGLRKLDHALDRAGCAKENTMAVTVSPQTDTITTWQIDPKHTLVEFSVKHLMVSTVRGRFGAVSGTIVEDESDLGRSTVQVEIDIASIDTREEQRDTHLRSADFLHMQDHPTITFKSTTVLPDKGDQFQVTGDLTIRGVTRPVTLKVTRNGRSKSPYGQEVAGFSAETSISRKEFGLTWNVALEAGGVMVGDHVKITLEVEAIKQA